MNHALLLDSPAIQLIKTLCKHFDETIHHTLTDSVSTFAVSREKSFVGTEDDSTKFYKIKSIKLSQKQKIV